MSASDYRLPSGGRVDRTRVVTFSFNGRPLQGFAGDTLASALLANGVRVVARSFKYHRARGILSAGAEEPNALVRVAIHGCAIPLVRATLQSLIEGMAVTSENCYPSVNFDFGRVLDFTHRLWPSGFYNKTFMWPSWAAYEPFIRRTAGLGTLPTGQQNASYYHHNIHCDVCVVGGGVVGLAAALAAANVGARVVLAEQDCELGGHLLGHRVQPVMPSLRWVEATEEALARLPNVRVMKRTLVAGYYDHNVLGAVDLSHAESSGRHIERFWRIRAREVVLATGAIEQPLVFARNDRPGIMLASAMRTYLNRFAVVAGKNVVVATTHDDAYRTAFDLHDAGVRIAGIVDTRTGAGTDVERCVQERGLTVYRSSMIADTRGAPAVSGVLIAPLSAESSRRHTFVDCDAVGMSSGWNPTLHLYSQSGGKIRYDSTLGCLLPQSAQQRVRISGAANGEFSLTTAVESGTRAGHDAALASRAGSQQAIEVSTQYRTETFALGCMSHAAGESRGRRWIDFQHDVTTADIELAVRENYVSVEHLKRYTTSGMSVDQGKTSNLNTLRALAQLSERTEQAVGTTTFRPPFMPVTLGVIAGEAHGDLYSPPRHLPAHAWHVSHGAMIEDYGGWKRPACYLRSGETRAQAIDREVRTVRTRLGLFDGTPLGKIEVRGKHAATFLDRMYVNNVASLEPRRVRYGLMLNENGVVIDDGVFARLSPEHYLVSTTGANAERITSWLDEWSQCEWPDLDAVILPTTTQWAVMTLVGAEARALLQQLDTDVDFSRTAFPHMSLREGHLNGLPVRVQRVSFTGELSYEISVAANHAETLWCELMRRGAAFGIDAVGIEAWLVLRLEKGFLHVGTDTDGTTNALDVGFGAIVEKKHGDFVGRRSLLRAADRSDDRRQLVGLEPLPAHGTFVAGAHLVVGPHSHSRSEGFITSAAYSPTLGRCIGLGLLERGRHRLGETVTVFDGGRLARARVVQPPFFDTSGTRMNG